MRIGCAGWSIASAQRHSFDAHGSALARYASRLGAVEINSSFYKFHRPETYARWADSVPAGFRFSVKVPRAITHEHRLVGASKLVDRFLGECLQLGGKLGGVLVQLPPSLDFDGRRAHAFFGMLRRRLPEGIAIACEPRNAGWFAGKADRTWSRFDIQRVGADPSPVAVEDAGSPGSHGQWWYWRLHGSPRMYYSAYPAHVLARLARKLKQAAASRPVWVIFDNTAAGHAITDALALQALTTGAGNPDGGALEA